MLRRRLRVAQKNRTTSRSAHQEATGDTTWCHVPLPTAVRRTCCPLHRMGAGGGVRIFFFALPSPTLFPQSHSHSHRKSTAANLSTTSPNDVETQPRTRGIHRCYYRTVIGAKV